MNYDEKDLTSNDLQNHDLVGHFIYSISDSAFDWFYVMTDW